MTDTYLAFMIGLLGSVHCVGMCGPLAFTIPVHRPGFGYLIFDKLSYQAGRIISYGILGAVLGLIGHQIMLAGIQRWFSLISGLLIVTIAVSRIFNCSLFNTPNSFLKPFHVLLAYALRHKANHLFVGMINGFLPCGFVFLAVTGALNTGSVSSAVAYMIWFGLGTTPLMFIAAISMGFLNNLVRRKINKSLPFVLLLAGIWFMLRGMELNIPFLSPKQATTTISNCA